MLLKIGELIGSIPIFGALMLAIGYTVVLGWIFKYTFISITGALFELGTDMNNIGGAFGATAPEASTLLEEPGHWNFHGRTLVRRMMILLG